MNKLTSLQKRGHAAGTGNNWEFHYDRRNIAPPVQRSAEELRAAQVKLAGMAMEQDDPQIWLQESLQALGLYRVL